MKHERYSNDGFVDYRPLESAGPRWFAHLALVAGLALVFLLGAILGVAWSQ